MKRLSLTFFLGILSISLSLKAQQSVSIGTNTINPKAVLWLSSPGQNQGLILPVVSNTTAVAGAGANERGMMVFNNADSKVYFFDGSTWIPVSGGTSTSSSKTLLNGTSNPTAATGTDGDFYINTTTNQIFGPKTTGAWGAGVSMIGPQGIQGIQGVQGPAGKSLLSGASNPTAATGVDGDFYINTASNQIFGPKASGAWGAGVNLVGPQGTNGTNGTNGKTVLSGASNPAAGTGVDGDFYINTASNQIFGPKASGAWGAGVNLVGPQGTNGTNGTNGKTVLSGASNPAVGTGADGDFYINTATNQIFGPKTAGAWGAGVNLVGPQGTNGTNGTNGKTVLSGASNPAAGTGVDGDFYINTATNQIFGPKTAGVWGAGVNLVGPQGTNGTDGKTVLNGVANPVAATGVDGDFYINTSTNEMFGPKVAGVWGAGTSLVGPQGPAGSGSLSGTTNYLVKFTAATSGGDSQLFDDGTNVGVGTNIPNDKLDVNGVVDATSYKVGNSFGTAGQYLRSNGTTGFVANTIQASDLPGGASAWSRTAPYTYTTNSGDNVGIGTTTPGSKLQVLQTSAGFNAGDYAINNASSTANALYVQTNGSSGNALYSYSSGGARAGMFQVNNSTTTANSIQSEHYGLGRAGHFEIANNSSGAYSLYSATNGSGAALYSLNSGSGRAGEFSVTGGTNNSAAVYVTHSGSGEGISVFNNGTGKAGLFTISNNTSNANALESNTNGTGWAAAFFGSALVRGKGNTSSTTAMRVENTSGVNLLKVFDNGNVSIGTPNALTYGGYGAVGLLTNKRGLTIASGTSYTADAPAVLELIGSAASVGEELGMIDFIHESSNGSTYNVARITAVRENSNPTYTGIAFYTRNLANLVEKMRITTTGNVGIGCTTPNYKLHVVGDIAAQGGTLRALSATISTTITACSDVRYKQDIRPITNVLPSLMQIQGVNYKFKVASFPERTFPETKQIGFIAQEVEKYYPEVVVTDNDGYKSIDYSRFAPLLLEAMKEQQAMINKQQQQNDELQMKLDAQTKKLEEIEAMIRQLQMSASAK